MFFFIHDAKSSELRLCSSSMFMRFPPDSSCPLMATPQTASLRMVPITCRKAVLFSACSFFTAFHMVVSTDSVFSYNISFSAARLWLLDAECWRSRCVPFFQLQKPLMNDFSFIWIADRSLRLIALSQV